MCNYALKWTFLTNFEESICIVIEIYTCQDKIKLNKVNTEMCIFRCLLHTSLK